MAHKFLLAFLLSFALAQQQHAQHNAQRRGSPHEGLSLKPQTSKSSLLSSLFTPLDNERAVATIAPAANDAAVRAFQSQHGQDVVPASFVSEVYGDLSIGSSRAGSLQDWEVESIVLLATVDGSIHARNRTTGMDIWKFDTETPMVETTCQRKPESKNKRQWLWIVEPNLDGNLYVFLPGPQAVLQKLGPTVKELVDERAPWASEDSPFVLTAEKRKNIFTLNATNGAAVEYFGYGSAGVVDGLGCHNVKGLEMDEENECKPTPVISLARTQYIVSIHDRDTGDVCTIKYWDWTPNVRNRNLQAQYHHSMDNKYIYSSHDGGIIALEHSSEKHQDNRFLYRKKLGSPVARVFDVIRPQGSDEKDATLVLLSQPRVPEVDNNQARNVFVNCTESGSWYAMSEFSYPSVTDGAKKAACYDPSLNWELFNDNSASNQPYIVGVHSIADYEDDSYKRPKIPLMLGAPHQLHQPANSVSAHVSEPTYSIGSDGEYRRTIDPPPPHVLKKDSNNALLGMLFLGILSMYLFQQYVIDTGLLKKLGLSRKQVEILKAAPVREEVEVEEVEAKLVPQPVPEIEQPADRQNSQPVEPEVGEAAADGEQDDEENEANGAADDVDSETPKKKKAHRGKRGLGRKKKAQAARRQAAEEKAAFEAIKDSVAPVNAPQPDGPPTLSTTVSDVTDILKLSGLQISGTILGRGSGGTMVFEGKFGTIDVAVKRMLKSYVQVASQEVELLQQSDHHRSIIRYFHQCQDKDFLYIAVEKCQASLNDLYGETNFSGVQTSLIQPEVKNDLLAQISLNVPVALRQLASGLSHLHSLRIIHRDLKPHNILIAYPRKNEKDIRLVISDFGLCRLLPDEASTLATTIGNAGTMGWKAPEIIESSNSTDPANGENSDNGSVGNPQDPEASIYSVNNEGTASGPSGSGRIKRAVDIFSLGCVFFYVLTSGAHPFDSRNPEFPGFERQFNIKRNLTNFDPLTRLGAEGEEPEHLIRNMLASDPRHRPTAEQVCHHPFFWNAKQRLDFLCDVSDHFEREERDPPSPHLQILESVAGNKVHGGDFLSKLDHKFVETLGKQRKYTTSRTLDLLRALRNKRNHYDDMPDELKAKVGELPAGYLKWWTGKFPTLLISCYEVVLRCNLEDEARFRGYFTGEL